MNTSSIPNPPESENARVSAPVLTFGTHRLNSCPQLRTLRTAEEFEKVRDCWTSWRGSRDSDLDLVLTICRSTPGVVRPYGFLLYKDEEPKAGLIGWVVRKPIPIRLGFVKIFNPLVQELIFPQGSLRGEESDQNCELLARGVADALRAGEADLAVFDHVCLGSCLIRNVRNAAAFPFRDWLLPVRPHWKKELPENSNLLHTRGEKRHLRQIEKKIRCDFPDKTELRRLTTVSELTAALSDVESVAAKSWQRKMGHGFRPAPELVDFLKTEAELGYLRLYLFCIDGTARAFSLGAVNQGTFYSDFIGYDPEYAAYSLGTLLLLKVMEDLCSEGVRVFDFGFTDDEYKRRYGNVTRPETSLHMFAPRPKGLRLALASQGAAVLNEGIRTLLDRVGLFHRVKLIWRKIGR